MEQQDERAFPISDLELISSGINLIQQGMAVFSKDLKLRFWNAQIVKMYSLPESLLYSGAPFVEIMQYLAEKGELGVGNTDELVQLRVDRIQETKPIYNESVRPNGTHILMEGQPLYQGGWVFVYTDITPQKQYESYLEKHRDYLSISLLERSKTLTETNRKLSSSNRILEETKAALINSERKKQIIAESVPAHIAVLSPNYIFTYSNRRYLHNLGTGCINLIGKSIEEVYGPAIFKILKPKVDEALTGRVVTFEFEVPISGSTIGASNQKVKFVRVTYTPDLNYDGTVNGVFVLSTDITEEVHAARKMINNKRMEVAYQLTSGLAHDFGNILTIILGNLKRIEEVASDNSFLRDLTQTARNATRRAVRIIDNLKSVNSRKTNKPELINVCELIQELRKLYLPSLSDDVAFTIDVPDHAINIFVDESELQDAIINLIVNAKDAVEDNGAINISAESMTNSSWNKPAVRIIVSDTGCGFSQEAMKKAFDPFFSMKTNKNNSGLGLSMVHRFVTQAGGTIDIESEPEKGSSVIITLPSEQNPNNTTDGFSSLIDERTILNKKILVINDETEIRHVIRKALFEKGFSVIEASDASEALKLVRQIEDLNIVLCDVVIPGNMDGIDLCNTLLAEKEDLAIVLMAGLPPHNELLEKAKGKFSVISKPVNVDRIVEAVAVIKSSGET